MIYRCPICDGQLQATCESYLINTTLDKEGGVIDIGDDCGCYGDTIVYCENDHTHEQILAKIKEGQPCD